MSEDDLKNFSKLYISNSVITGCTNTTFDLPMIYRYVKIQDFILKTQYNNKQKDSNGESDCKTFYNQVTFSLKNKANVKLFGNGKFQISGVKDISSAKTNLLSVISLLRDIRGRIDVVPEFIRKVSCFNGKVLIDYEGVYKCSAVYKNGFFIINGEVCIISDFDDRIFISNRHVDKKKNLYNLNCEHIGQVDYIMKRKNKNLCLKGAYFTKKSENLYIIHDKYVNDIPIGEMHVDIFGEVMEHKNQELVTLEYSACNENIEILEIVLSNLNCNIKYILQGSDMVDRDALCKYIDSKDIKYNYDPCKYPGVKIEYQNTKITIFRTGSILFSGKSNIKEVILWVGKIFNENNLIKKINEFVEIKEEFSIWDI